ncbi:maltokinase [Marmoricola sp. OAE513]|uniref:maltokinase N-terminal cap-like domain-containing protein n=1 Tax=Marmoricola sp. OAE513 TaxID=2817894 RepID=UPI001AE495C1
MTPDQIAAYIADARWFGGKGRAFEVTAVTELVLAPGVSTNLVRLSYADGGTDLYQIPLSSYDEPQERLAHAAIGIWDDRHHYDAVHDRDAMQVWLEAFAGAPSDELDEHVSFTRTSEHELDRETHSTPLSGEQSNSSLAFGDDALLKVFRRLEPGTNPDIEIHEVLTAAESTHIAALHGHVVADVPDLGRIDLAMLQQFLRTASDGWELALASVRNLVMETDLLPEESGGDFAAEAHRLGAGLAEIHDVLQDSFGTGTADGAYLADQMQTRLDEAAQVVPELGEMRFALTSSFDAIRALGALDVQRIHGDLHLGQTLRTSLGWKFVDFEGEPAKSLEERRLPDSTWRDVAGMVRSFDYAASTVSRDLGGAQEEAAEITHRAESWTAHTTAAFLAGYAEQRGEPMSDAEGALLRAYIADKAIYEAVYETRNRPSWVGIPLLALSGIVGSAA